MSRSLAYSWFLWSREQPACAPSEESTGRPQGGNRQRGGSRDSSPVGSVLGALDARQVVDGAVPAPLGPELRGPLLDPLPGVAAPHHRVPADLVDPLHREPLPRVADQAGQVKELGMAARVDLDGTDLPIAEEPLVTLDGVNGVCAQLHP